MCQIRKRMIILFVLLSLVQLLSAVNYKVLFVNSGTVKIGGKKAVRDMVFDEKEDIEWSSENQAMKVQNMSSSRVIIIAAKSLLEKKTKSLSDYFGRVKHLSTRGYVSHNIITDTVSYLLDTLKLDAGQFGQSEAKLVVHAGDVTMEKPVHKSADGFFYVLTRTLFDGINSKTVSIDIEVTEQKLDWHYYVYRRLNVVILPLQVD